LRLWWGSLFAVLAFLIRPLAVVLPVSVLATLVPAGIRTSARRILPPVAAAILIMVVLWIAEPRLLGRLPVAERRVQNLHYLSLVPWKEYMVWDVNLSFIAVFPCAPLL